MAPMLVHSVSPSICERSSVTSKASSKSPSRSLKTTSCGVTLTVEKPWPPKLSDDPEVRHTAINAIAQIGGRGAARALERLAEVAGEADLELIDAALEEVGTLLEPFEQSS